MVVEQMMIAPTTMHAGIKFASTHVQKIPLVLLWQRVGSTDTGQFAHVLMDTPVHLKPNAAHVSFGDAKQHIC